MTQKTLLVTKNEQQPVQRFDNLCKMLSDLKNRKKQIEMEMKTIKSQELDLTTEIGEMREKGTAGKDWTADWVEKRRSVGKPSNEALEALMGIDPRMIRQTPGKVWINSSNSFDLHKAFKLLEKEGFITGKEEVRSMPEALTKIDNIMKERPELFRERKHIYDLLDLKVSRELLVIPTILNPSDDGF